DHVHVDGAEVDGHRGRDGDLPERDARVEAQVRRARGSAVELEDAMERPLDAGDGDRLLQLEAQAEAQVVVVAGEVPVDDPGRGERAEPLEARQLAERELREAAAELRARGPGARVRLEGERRLRQLEGQVPERSADVE